MIWSSCSNSVVRISILDKKRRRRRMIRTRMIKIKNSFFILKRS